VSTPSASIVPIALTVNERTGLTLWAPPWVDEDGEEWQGFLGDGAKILLFPGAGELAEFIASGTENDLSDHPAWPQARKAPPALLRPAREDVYNLDQVYDWAAGDPTPETVSALANVIDMTLQIGESCDDGALRRLVGSTPEYLDLLDEHVSFQGKEGRRAWLALGEVIAETWERAIGRVEQWLSWQGDFSAQDADDLVERDAPVDLWSALDAVPIALRLPDADDEPVTWLTLRAQVDGDVLFLGSDMTVAVFADAAALALFCRAATEHDLTALPHWNRVREEDDDEAFEPGPRARFDLMAPSDRGAQLLRELARYTHLESDFAALDDDPIDPADWREMLSEIAGLLAPENG
jgi:hypothetical protein